MLLESPKNILFFNLIECSERFSCLNRRLIVLVAMAWYAAMLPSLRQPARCDNLDIAGEGNKTSINLDKILGAASNYYVDSLTPVTNHST